MKKLLAIAALSVATITTASAQLRVGPEVGLNLTTVQKKIMGNSENSDLKVGGRIGIVADLALTNSLYLRPGVQFAMMGGKESVTIPATIVTPEKTYTTTTDLSYIQVPVNVLYKFGEAGYSRLYIGLTPYVGFAIGGKQKSDGLPDYTIEFGDDKDMKSLDFGAGLKLGYELPMGLYVDLSYLQGFTNNLPKGNSDNKFNNNNITLGIGYLFGGSRY